MTTITTGAASENGSTDAVRDTASGSKNRTITGSLKSMFRKLANAITSRDEDEPRPRARRRGGETEGDLRRPGARPARAGAAAARGRYAALRSAQATVLPDAYADAGLYLANTIDWLNLWENNANNEQWMDNDFSVKQDHCFPQA